MKSLRALYVWLAFLVPLGIFAVSLAPGVGLWDTAEMQLEPWILGVPHPTGFPAFVMLGWAFTHLVPFGNPAWRTGLFSALAMAGSCATLALVLREFEMPRWAALLGAWIFAVGDVVWTRGSRTEVLAVAFFFASLSLLFAVRWLRTKVLRDALIAAGACGLGLATHPVTIFLGPGLVLVAIVGYRALTPRRALAIVAAAAAPLALYAFIPLRSAYLYGIRRDPTLGLGLAPGRPFWDTNHAAGGLHEYLSAAPGQIGGGVAGLFSAGQWSYVYASYSGSLLHEFGIAGVLLGLLGLALAFRERPLVWAALVISVGVTVPFILNYPEADQERYFIGSFWLFSAAIVIGAYRGFVAYTRHAREGAIVAALVLAAVFVTTGASNETVFDQASNTQGDDFVRRVIAATPANAIVVSEWTYVTPLAYAAYATNDFGDRIVVSGWPTDYADHYKEWLKTRPVFVHVLSTPIAPLPPETGVEAVNLDPASYLYEIRPIAKPPARRAGR